MNRAATDTPLPPEGPRRMQPVMVGLLGVVVLLGALLRAMPTPASLVVGPDERFYADYYVANLVGAGPGILPALFRDYATYMRRSDRQLVLPPGRIAFFLHAAVLAKLGVRPHLEAVRAASMQASVLFLLAAALFAGRWLDPPHALATTLLVAAAPLQLYVAHRALVDGAFALAGLLTLWTLWESIQPGARTRWRLALAGAVAFLILTKENSAFVLGSLAIALAWFQFRANGRRPDFWWAWAALAAGTAIAIALLMVAAGGPGPLITAYRLNVEKSYLLEYARVTGDGPAHRYLLDLLAVNPLVFILAAAGIWSVRPFLPGPGGFLGCFLVSSLVLMTPVRYAMNLRYGLVWDFPLCVLAACQLHALATGFQGPAIRQHAALAMGVTLVAATSLACFTKLFVTANLYEPLPKLMLEAWKILKH